ncbi:MAG: DNA translocase FtsK 4TM domain-containing protein [Lachnospiraceae bacterium]
MASKSNSRRKSSTRAKSSGKKKTTKKAANPITNEVVLLLVIGFVILLFLSLLGVCGTAGDIISKPVFGLFGMLGYIFPFAVAIGVFILVANEFSGASQIKTGGLVLTYLSACGLFHMMDNRSTALNWKDTYAECAARHVGGGGIGFLVDKILSPFGMGAVVIICILIIVGLVILTERSFINGVREQGTKVYQKTKDNLENYRADVEEKQIRRLEKKVSGVAMEDTLIPKDGIIHKDVRDINEKVAAQKDKYSDDIYEIKPVELKGKDSGKKLEGKTNGDSEVIPYIDRMMARQEEEPKNEDSLSANDPFKLVFTDAGKKETANKVQDEKVDPKTTRLEKEDMQEREEVLRDAAESHNRENARKDAPKKESAKTEVLGSDVLEIPENGTSVEASYKYPSLNLLKKMVTKKNMNQDSENLETAKVLQQTLQSFGVNVTVTDVSCGPSVTRYELLPERGTKVSKIVSLADDIKLNLAAADIRIEAPIPGKAAVGIEVPNKEATGVSLRELLESDEFQNHPSKIAFAAGKDIAGKVIVADIAKMPHLLIAGATGSGKSVCINTIVMSILYKARPDEVKLILVDPKVVELSVYNGIPHLMIPVVTDPKKASQALNWAVAEMTDRYKKFAEVNVRDLKGYNEKIANLTDIDEDKRPKKLPQIVIIIDELADLMMVAPGEVEDAICRLAQLARACGIHLVIATQRPSVNVITGLIKANVPSRIAFSVSSGVDSRTILDMIGAEKLLGKGDMLFFPSGYPKPVRAQGAFVSDKEVGDVVEFLASSQEPATYNEEVIQAVNMPSMEDSQAFGGDRDQYFAEAGRFIIEKERASIGLIQRFYKVGFNRAARIMDQLAEAGVVGPEEGTKPRKVLMTMEEFEEYLNSGN